MTRNHHTNLVSRRLLTALLGIGCVHAHLLTTALVDHFRLPFEFGHPLLDLIELIVELAHLVAEITLSPDHHGAGINVGTHKVALALDAIDQALTLQLVDGPLHRINGHIPLSFQLPTGRQLLPRLVGAIGDALPQVFGDLNVWRALIIGFQTHRLQPTRSLKFLGIADMLDNLKFIT